MSIRGKWRIVRMPAYEADFPDMMGPAYLLFGKSGGEFAFGCVTGAIHRTAKGDAAEFTWSGNDENGGSLRRRMGRATTRRDPRRTDLLPRRR